MRPLRPMMPKRAYELWEIYKDGKHGDIFEVIDCVIPSYEGMQVKVVTADGGYKALVKPEADNPDDATTLITVYGCLGTAKYKKVDSFKKISFEDALNRINNFRTVYAFDGREYIQVSKYTDFEDIDVSDFADLLTKPFYIKEAR